VHKRTLDVARYHVGKVKPYTPEFMSESKAKLELLAARDKARMMLEEARNNYEAYIYYVKNKCADDEEAIAKVTNAEQRESLLKLTEDASEWLDSEGFDADLETFQTKHAELAAPADAIFFRVSEATARPMAVAALKDKLSKVEELMTQWETSMPQVTDEERGEVLAKVAEVRKWIEEKEAAQTVVNTWDAPVFNSAEVPLQTKSIERVVGKLSKKPKPKPVEDEKKNETAAVNETKSTEDNVSGKDEVKTEEPGDAEPAQGDEL